MQTVEEVLTRFLTREEAYKDLIAAVKTSEYNLETLKKSLNESKNYLQSLKTKQGEENIHVEHEVIRNAKRSLVNYKEMSYKYRNLLQSMHE